MSEQEIKLRPNKVALANNAIRKHKARTFADIGGCWGVHAGYTRDVLANNYIEKAYVADQFVTGVSRELGAEYKQLEFVSGLFNTQSFIDSFPEVDALLMYDILLHQVDMDWDAFLEAWSKKARVVVIYNQMWKADEKTFRFIDRGADWYRKWVYYNDVKNIDDWLSTLDSIDEKTGKKRRDLHSYWQFAITTSDLIAKMKSLGFRLDLFENHGPFHPKRTPWIQDEAFVFVRDDKERKGWPS